MVVEAALVEVASTAAAAELMSSLLAGRRSEEEFSHASFPCILHGCLAPTSAHWPESAAGGGEEK